MPTAAATAGLTTVTVASGAVSPAPRYAACESSSPPAASTAIAARSGHSPADAPASKLSATDFVNTEAIPKDVPAAAASSTLRSTARCARRAARNSSAAPPAVTDSSRVRSVPARASRPAPSPPVSARSPARPAVARTAPRQAAAPARRPTKTAAIGRAKTMVSAPSGWTRLSGPYASASTCSRAPSPFRATATHQPARRSGAQEPSGELAATCSWTIAPLAYATAETRQRRTDRARALMHSTMPHPGPLFIRPRAP